MSHVRTQLRAALQTVLTGLPTTGNRVVINRSAPVAASRTPCLIVTTPSEEIEPIDTAQTLMRKVVVQIEALASGAAIDEQLDQMAAEVEPAVAGLAAVFPALKFAPQYQGMEIERDDTASPPVGSLRMLYQITVITFANNPETPL